MLTTMFRIWLQDPNIPPVWTGVRLVGRPHYINAAWRWTRYRSEKIKRLLSLQQRLKRRECQARTRVCKSCACEWFALPVFFPTHTDKRKRGARISMSRTCRICKMKLKLEKGMKAPCLGKSLVRLSKMPFTACLKRRASGERGV